MKTQAQISAIIEELKQLYPDALCSLEYQKDYELLFSVRLAAQCTDARVNLVTPALFERFPTLEAFAAATPDECQTAEVLYVHCIAFTCKLQHILQLRSVHIFPGHFFCKPFFNVIFFQSFNLSRLVLVSRTHTNICNSHKITPFM